MDPGQADIKLSQILAEVLKLSENVGTSNQQLQVLVSENRAMREEIRDLKDTVQRLSVERLDPVSPRQANAGGVRRLPSQEPQSPPTNPGTVQAWHQSEAFGALVRAYHEEYAKCPPKDVMQPAKVYNDKIVTTIRDYFRKDVNVAKRIEYTGSSYEDLKIASTTLEFDCMVILRGGKSLVKDDTSLPVGYTKFMVTEGHHGHLREMLNKEGYLSSELVRRWFMGQMQNAKKALVHLGVVEEEHLKIHENGPAVMMKVYRPDTGAFWFDVDMVPAFEFQSGSEPDEFYVAKSYEDVENPGEVYTTWRRSFSLDEKKILKSIDKGSGCRKMCVRILKALREKDAPLKNLQSYFLKTTLLNMVEDKSDANWDQDQIGMRFIELLEQLRDHLQAKNLPNHFLREMNLIYLHKEIVLYNIATRIDKLLRSQIAMTKILQVE